MLAAIVLKFFSYFFAPPGMGPVSKHKIAAQRGGFISHTSGSAVMAEPDFSSIYAGASAKNSEKSIIGDFNRVGVSDVTKLMGGDGTGRVQR